MQLTISIKAFMILSKFVSLIWLIHSPIFAEDKVAVQFVSFPKISNSKPIELWLGDEKTILVEIPTNKTSRVYNVNRLKKWTLGKTMLDDAGDSFFKAYGQALSLKSSKQLILVLRKGLDDEQGLMLIPLDYSTVGFTGGEYFIFNASNIDVAGIIGTSKFALKPRKFKVLSPKPTKEKSGRKYCFTKFFYREKNGAQPFFSATWRYNTGARSIVFFYNDLKTKHLKLHTIRNYIR